ncbi:VTT domain-containing protein [Roseomonas sp. GC11]|uniref:VTT domain-containing protein n=1 Tax=Roseomonas sp. GC11 TaxID=2950546 RepID=UPI00210DCACA|nr:VTT domain-containing protein [Roseomonas sp. GC11]MCQ4159159.1 VTT domain-containing protein [Roseomonas sp. GC11]
MADPSDTLLSPPAPPQDGASLLRPGRNVWRIAQARRAAVLVDGATYYGALREAMKRARDTILVAGWDIDSRTPLVGPEGEAKDGLPAQLGPFLAALAARRPNLRVKLLLWDYSMLYALERELLPALRLQWNTPPQVELCLDDEVAFGASHHQKIAIVDDALAFSGGLDLTIRRWDTPEHRPENPHRVDPGDVSYPPFHDIQMMVDGEAATALAALFRDRWSRAACEDLPPPAPRPATAPDLWPRHVAPDFRDAPIGIARTHGSFQGEPEVREVERLFEDMIGGAEHSLYIENQFLTHLGLARRLAARLAERPGLEVVILGPRTHHTWLEHRTMLAGRIRFMEVLRQAGVAERVRLLCPQAGLRHPQAADIMVHAKLMIADDRLLRVGSANLCNRSMGTDSECDLVVEARDTATRQAIAAVQDRLLAEHLGASPAQVAALRQGGGLFRAIDGLAGRARQLRPIEDGRLEEGEGLPQIEAVADPARALGTTTLLADFTAEDGTPHGLPLWLRVLLVVAPVALLGLAWHSTPLSALLHPGTFSASLQNASGPLGPLLALGLFMVLGLVAFPVNVLILATAAAFGLWPGLLYAGAGALISAFLTYLLGRRAGTGLLRKLAGPRINRISRAISRNGILAVTMVRLMPVAPFTLVNLVAGAMRIPLFDYMAGTALGLAPGLVLMTALGDRLLRILTDPSAGDMLGFALVLVAWGGLSYGLQSLVSWFRRRAARHAARREAEQGAEEGAQEEEGGLPA